MSSEIFATEKRLTTNSHELTRSGRRGHREKKGYQENRRLGSGGQEIRKANRGLRPRGPRSGANYRTLHDYKNLSQVFLQRQACVPVTMWVYCLEEVWVT